VSPTAARPATAVWPPVAPYINTVTSDAPTAGPIQWGFNYSYVLLGGHQAPPYMFFENNRVDGNAGFHVHVTDGKLPAKRMVGSDGHMIAGE